jgi:hypothetical protein
MHSAPSAEESLTIECVDRLANAEIKAMTAPFQST